MEERTGNTLGSFTRHYVLPLWRWYLGGTIFLALTNAIVLVLPRLARDLVNTLGGGELAEAALRAVPGLLAANNGTAIPLAIMGLGLVLVIVRILSRILFFWPGRRVEAETRQDIFAKILRIPRTLLYRFGQGDLVSRIANDTGYLRILFAFGFLSVVNVVFLLTMTMAAMLSFHPTLTFFALISFAPLLVLIRYTLPAMHAASKRNQEAMGRLSTVMTETFRGISSVRLHAAQSAFLERIDGANEAVYQSNRRLAMIQMVVFPVAGLAVHLAQTIVLIYGGTEVIAGRLQAGDIMVFNVYMASLAFPLAFSGSVLALIERARSAHTRIAEVLSLPAESAEDVHTESFAFSAESANTEMLSLPAESANTEGTVVNSGEGLLPRSKIPSTDAVLADALLEIRSLSREFGTPISSDSPGMVPAFAEERASPKDARSPAPAAENSGFKFDNINFSLRQGEVLGICGAVGSGKSLLFDLILRFEEPPPASIFFHGRDVLAYPPALLRARIACALQNTRLLSDSIRANLTLGLGREVSDEELAHALERACILDEVRNFSGGLETVTGEKGMRLSGGQRQRLALARLFLRRPEVFLLDDIFSAVDQKTETRLVDEIMLLASRTGHKSGLRTAALIATHRHSVLESCDEVLLLHAGRLVDRGRYAELAARHRSLFLKLDREGCDA